MTKEEWLSKRPERNTPNKFPKRIELCGGCASARIFRLNGAEKCFGCGYEWGGVMYVKVKGSK